MRKTLLPARNALRCARCQRDWSKSWSERETDDVPFDAMFVWTCERETERVTGRRLQCCGDCDDQGADDKSMNLSHFVGPDQAWSGAEELLASYKWPAPLRRKLFAFLRDASRLDPNAKTTRAAT